MILNRKNIAPLLRIFDKIGENKNLNISAQYKLLKIKRIIVEEQQIYQEQLKTNCEQFFVKEKDGAFKLNSDGSYTIESGKIEECERMIQKISDLSITVQDIFLSLDEIDPLNLTMNELELFYDFIK